MSTTTDNEPPSHPNNDIPPAKQRRLTHFRAQHQPKTLTIGAHRWTYWVSGEGDETVLVLPGSGAQAEAMFPYIEGFARLYRVIAPDTPVTLKTIADAVAGLRAILGAEGIKRAHVFGASFGGLLAQVYVRRFPDTVGHLILAQTGLPTEHLAERANMQRAFIAFYPAPLMMWLARRTLRRDIWRTRTPSSEGEQAFWSAYFDALYRGGFDKRALLSRSRLSCDYFMNHRFKANDLEGWPGQVLILEASHDEVYTEGDRGALKSMYPRAISHTFWGYDHFTPLLAWADVLDRALKFLRDEVTASDYGPA